MEMQEFLKVIKNRRVVRRFKPDPVPDEYVNNILEAARWCPSGANSQPWEFIVVKKAETKKKLAEIFAKYREITLAMELTRLPEYRQPAFRTQSLETMEQDARARFVVWADAPVIIVLLGDARVMQCSTLAARMYEYHTYDHNLAVCNYIIHLAASVYGLGAQWTGVLQPPAEEMKAYLGVPPLYTLFALAPIGYPAIHPTPYRRELKELVHSEKYDMSLYRSNKQIQDYVRFQRQKHAEGGTYRSSDKEVAGK